jgi:hypothetical protein
MGLELAVGLLLAVLVVAPSVSAARHIVFKANGGPVQVRPETIYASPTNGPFAKHLSWSDWGQNRTEAEGTVYYDTCEPDCSEGYHSTPGEVILSGVHRCKQQLRYALLRIVYFPAPQYNLRATYNCNGTPTHVHIGR